MNAVIFASGQSLTDDQCQQARQTEGVLFIAISDAYKKAPWCDALCAIDRAWWRNRPEALPFGRRRFCLYKRDGVEAVQPDAFVDAGCSSGHLGIYVAARVFHCERAILLGFDMHGTHFFGPHELPLKNTSSERFRVFKKQLQEKIADRRLIDVRNCTPGTALKCFPELTLDEGLSWVASSTSKSKG